MTTWKSVNIAVGAAAFTLPALMGLLVQLVWIAQMQPANQLSVLVVLAPIPLLCWWTYLAGQAESLRRVVLPAAVVLVTVGFWSTSVGWRWTAGAGLLTVIFEVVRVAACEHQFTVREFDDRWRTPQGPQRHRLRAHDDRRAPHRPHPRQATTFWRSPGTGKRPPRCATGR